MSFLAGAVFAWLIFVGLLCALTVIAFHAFLTGKW